MIVKNTTQNQTRDPPGKRLPTEFTFERLLSSMIPHVVPVRVLSVETLVAEVTFVQPLPVCPHVPQQHEAAGELLLADVTLERFLPGVISDMVIQNVSSIKGLRTVGTFELLKDYQTIKHLTYLVLWYKP